MVSRSHWVSDNRRRRSSIGGRVERRRPITLLGSALRRLRAAERGLELGHGVNRRQMTRGVAGRVPEVETEASN